MYDFDIQQIQAYGLNIYQMKMYGLRPRAMARRSISGNGYAFYVIGQKFPGHYCVFHDDYNGMCDITNLLIAKGRKRLGYIGVMMQDKAAGVQRYNGFKAAAELLKRYPEMDGLVCATDEIAIGAMQYLLEQGVRIPEDVYIAGLGDSIMARVAGHCIATVHNSYEKCGEVAATMLLEILTTGETAYKEIMLGYYLVENATYGVKEK